MASFGTTGTLTGFHVDKQSLGISQLWSNVHASQHTSVLQLAARDPTEHVYSQAKVLFSLLDAACLTFASGLTNLSLAPEPQPFLMEVCSLIHACF